MYATIGFLKILIKSRKVNIMKIKVNLLGDYVGNYIVSNLEHVLMAAVGISLIGFFIWKIVFA